MKKYYVSINLIKSERWRQFLESTATALQMNLVLFAVGTQEHFSACGKCPVCGFELSPYSEDQSPTRGPDTNTPEPELFYLDETFCVTARNYPCCHGGNPMEAHERVTIARELLSSFYGILNDHTDAEKRRSGLAALRQTNHIILSVFRGNQHAFERVAELVLSACIILFNAEGSWLEYEADAQQFLLTKGNCVFLSGNPDLHKHKASIAEIYSPVMRASLGILPPVNQESARDVLDLVVSDYMSLFETNKLLRLMESKRSLILDAVDSMILLVDSGKNICYTNKAASELLNRSVCDLIHHDVCEIDAPWRSYFSSATGGVVKGLKDQLICGSGEKYIDWQVCPLAGDCDISGWFIVASDRTDFYRFQELSEKVENSIHNSKMLNVVAHEIRNPLATFKGLLQIIRLKSASPEIDKYVTIGLNEIDKLALIMDEFSQFGKAAPISLKKTDLKSFIEEVIILIKTGFSGPDIEIEASIETVKPVLADKRQMTQVVFNLVKNAAEALDYRGIITLILRQFDDNWVEIRVRDNGPGISDHVKDKMFRQYFSTKIDGAGLGLAITESIVKKHNGKISCDNLPSGGACFSILLPTYPASKLQKPDGSKILILTNDDSLRRQSERLFNEENIECYSLKKHDSIFSTIKRFKPGIIFIDDNYLSRNILTKLLGNILSGNPELKILIAGERVHQADSHVSHIKKPLNDEKLIDSVMSLLNIR